MNSGFHLAPAGSSKCDYGTTIDESDCEGVVRSFAATFEQVPGQSMQIGSGGSCLDGSWGQVPVGCSAQSGGSWTAHYKTSTDNGEGCIHSAYQLVCLSTGKYFIRVC